MHVELYAYDVRIIVNKLHLRFLICKQINIACIFICLLHAQATNLITQSMLLIALLQFLFKTFENNFAVFIDLSFISFFNFSFFLLKVFKYVLILNNICLFFKEFVFCTSDLFVLISFFIERTTACILNEFIENNIQ